MIILALLLTFARPPWVDFDQDRLNTRNEILARDSIVAPQISCGRNRCKVVSGLWLDPYSGEYYLDPANLDIDHVVPLKEAYRSRMWDREEFERFANDEENLLVVNVKDNRTKSDKGPDIWPEPSRWVAEPFWCKSYIDKYLLIKEKWHMTIKDSERAVKGRCPS
jgi:hypothetical protein